MKGKSIQQKDKFEVNKEIWVLKRNNGDIINSFRTKATAERFKQKYAKLYLEEIILGRI